MRKTLLLCLIVTGYSLIGQTDSIQKAVKLYQSHKYNFGINFPDNWKELKIQDHELLISAPNVREGVVTTTFDIRVNIDNSSLKSYLKKYQASLEDSKTFISVKLLSKRKITFKGNKAFEVHYTALVQQLPIEWKSVIFKYKNNVFKLTTTSQMGELLIMSTITNIIFDSFYFY